MSDKKADLAGPGISTYPEVAKILPTDYDSVLTPMETMKALYAVKRYIEDGLARELNLQMVQVPLIVDTESGVNDMLDRDGSRTPVEFPAGLGIDPQITAQVVQAATKWKRPALEQFECKVGEGINTDMRAVRKDYFLDHDHSSYVDQWDWEKVITEEDRNLDYLRDTVQKIWKVLRGAGHPRPGDVPAAQGAGFPDFPEELKFLHAEEILEMYPDLPRKQRETAILQEYPAVFIIGIGYPLEDGYPHEMRAADYDDWITPTVEKNGEELPRSQRRHPGLEPRDQAPPRAHLDGHPRHQGDAAPADGDGRREEYLELPYHQAILNDEIPLSIGGGIGQSRTYMYLLRKAHLGEVSVTIWPDELKEICAEKNIHVLE